MSETHISYEVSKRLKEFLGESAPEPIRGYYWMEDESFRHLALYRRNAYAAYALEDLLSRPFCEAFFKVYGPHEFENGWAYEDDYDVAVVLMERYYRGGLPAVEAELMKMMEAK